MVTNFYLQRNLRARIAFDLLYIPTPKYHLLAHIQLINYLYNEVKGLASI